MNGVYRPSFPLGAIRAAMRRFVPGVTQPVTPAAGTLCAHLSASQPLTARSLVAPVLTARLKAVQCGE